MAAVWGVIALIDYIRAEMRLAPLFTIVEWRLPGGSIRYSGLGYDVMRHNQMPEDGGRAGTEFYFVRDDYTIHRFLSVVLPGQLFLFVFQAAFTVLFCKLIPPKYIFLAPAATILSMFLLLVIGFGLENADFHNASGWTEIAVTLVYSILLTLVIYLKRKKKSL
jgi:hypothetical protein